MHHIDDNIKPKQQPYRRVPNHLLKPIEDELKKLQENDIIEKVTKPPDCVSALVAVPKPKKPGEVRITIDSRLANKAVKRIKYVVPTTEEIAYEWCYHHVEDRSKQSISSISVRGRQQIDHNFCHTLGILQIQTIAYGRKLSVRRISGCIARSTYGLGLSKKSSR